MKTENGIPMNNKAVASLPKHLLQFAVDQRYDDYTPVDHAVWRFIMRQNIFFLKEYAHKALLPGPARYRDFLRAHSADRGDERDPRQDRLGRRGGGWLYSAGGVHGIPGLQVLVIACDMRQINHIEYTPAPDIVHEAAGHAPIIVDQEYADYLQRFGEVGAKAMSSKKDFELYEAIRHLSILKEQPNPDPTELEKATKLVEERQKNLGEPSEMALLSRLHWWTVEYGLIGPLDKPKIYGAGLLSSIGESVSCLEPKVKKIPYSIDAAERAFDITTKQPQLFVTRDFQHLAEVLEEFASRMAFRVGGLEGINKAIECKNTATCEYSSGLQVSGVFTEVLDRRRRRDLSAHDWTERARLAETRNLPGTVAIITRKVSARRSAAGKRTLPKASRQDDEGNRLTKFESGVVVTGRVEKILRHDGKLLLITFTNCRVTVRRSRFVRAGLGHLRHGGRRTHRVGLQRRRRQRCLQPGRARSARTHDQDRPRMRNERSWKAFTHRCAIFGSARSRLRAARRNLGTPSRPSTPTTGCSRWRFSKSSTKPKNNELKRKVQAFLETQESATKDLSTLIEWGFRLVAYHRQGQATAQSEKLLLAA